MMLIARIGAKRMKTQPTFLIDIPDDNARLQLGKVESYQTSHTAATTSYEHHLARYVLSKSVENLS